MANTTTIYDVRVRLFMRDGASRAARNVAVGFANADKQARSLRRTVMGVTGALVGMAGIRAGKRAFIDFNREMQTMKIGFGTLINMNVGGSFETAQQHGAKLVDTFQQMAKASVGTTKEFLFFGKAITAPVLGMNQQLGTTQKRLEQLARITKGGVIAASVMGERPDLAARDIEQFLAGTLSLRDRFARQLLRPLGIDHKAVNKMKPPKRLELLEKLLTQPAIQKAAKMYETSFEGVTSTLIDNLQILAGKIGLPLFKAITAEVRKWNQWIEKNPRAIAQFAKTFSETLVAGFNAIKAAVAFIINNRGTLLTMAKAFVAFKVTRLAGSLVGGATTSLGAMMVARREQQAAPFIAGLGAMTGATSAAAKGALTAGEKLAKFAAGMNIAIAAAAALAGLAVASDNLGDHLAEERIKRDVASQSLKGFADRALAGSTGSAIALLRDLRNAGVLQDVNGKKDQFNTDALGRVFGRGPFRKMPKEDLQRLILAVQKAQLEELRLLRENAFQTMGRALFGGAEKMLGAVWRTFAPDTKKIKMSPKVNVNVRRMEVVAPDPDRFAIGMRELTESVLRRPTVSATLLRRSE